MKLVKRTFLIIILALNIAIFSVKAESDYNRYLNIENEIQSIYDNTYNMVQDLDENLDYKKDIEQELKSVKTKLDTFILIDITENVKEDDFLKKAEEIKKQISKVQQSIINPSKLIDKNPELQKGDFMDFLVTVIKLLMRLASLTIFVSLIVSGVMFIIAFQEEEKIDKAKRILYFSLIGFAFILMAFAMITALSDIKIF